ncbi:MAG: prepilin-type N-terminal cleavage/methylation domain-containing protein [Nitrospira sp.]|nr:prepilin-type N-terminal cleavage/methylation domain-containing protein [Nitrospira sp.]
MVRPKVANIVSSHARDGGFTLIEIAIVLAIIGIAAALAGPNLMSLYARYELYQTTTSLHRTLLMARSAAIARNTVITATLSNLPNGQGQVTFNAVVTAEPFPLTVGFVLPPPAQPIGFTSRGLSTTPFATQTIQLQSLRNPNLIYTISLTPAGKVTWCNQAVNPCLVQSG